MTLNTFLLTSTFVLGALAQTVAAAQEAAAPQATVASQASQPASLSGSSAASSASKTVPGIVIRWDCGNCEENPKVAPLIEKTYRAEALAKGHTVSTTEIAEIAIKEYRQRHPATRSLFGAFAGQDKLATRMSLRGKDYDAKDYSVNAFQGMNSLCESIARQTLAQVLTAP